MPSRLSSAVLTFLLGALLSCSSFNEVHLVGRNFTDEVQLSQNMVFTFNKDLVQESRLGVWDSTQYVKFSPAVRGKFKSTAPNELVFSPVAALAPATAYKAELTDELLKHVDADNENLPRARGVSALNIALPDGNGRKGVYLVSVNSKDEAYLGSTKLISVSDIGLIAKEGDDEVWIFANSIKTTEPLKSIEITLVSGNNQSMQTIETDGDGVAHFEKLSEKAPASKSR